MLMFLLFTHPYVSTGLTTISKVHANVRFPFIFVINLILKPNLSC